MTETSPDTTQQSTEKAPAFASLGIAGQVLKGVDAAGFEKPSDIQAELIPIILEGHDVMGQARTGTGKTAAFALPILQMADPQTPAQALILAPTRELAAQISAEIDQLGKHTNIRTVSIIGGESMRQQDNALKRGAHMIVGTPGRVMDLHSRGRLSFDNVKFAVLDEVDRMLDIGFRDDIRKILSTIKIKHQTIFVSATISDEIERLARRFMTKDARKISVVSGSMTVEAVDQSYLTVEPWDKRSLLLHLLRNEQPDTVVVFCRTKATVHKVTAYLKQKGISAREIHGDLHQKKRSKVMDSMRQGNVDVLVASDLAARGLDVDHITHVINYDLPEDPELYIHRIGRTARAGRRGVAWSFVTPEEGQRLTEIEKLASVLIEPKDYPDFKPGRVPQDVADARRLSDGPRKSAEPEPAAHEADQLTDEQKRAMFPDGVVPTGPPRKTLGGRFKRRRR